MHYCVSAYVDKNVRKSEMTTKKIETFTVD
jgi:hypothetical protein